MTVLLIVIGCGDDMQSPSVTCGFGTYEKNGQCFPWLTCGQGAAALEGECRPIDASPVPPPPPPPDAAVIDAIPILCGAGTHSVVGECVPNAGTPGYAVRVTPTIISADIDTKIPVLLLGPMLQPGDSPAVVRLAVDPPNAGTLDSRLLTLDGPSASAWTYFRPCDGRPSCLEPFHIVMTVDGDQQTVLATSEPLETVARTGIGSPAACLGGGNRMFLFSDYDFIYSGYGLLVTEGWFLSDSPFESTQTVYLRIYPTVAPTLTLWSLAFSTERLGQPIQVGEYDNAQEWQVEPANTPGMDIGGDGRGCNRITGAFQVWEFEAQGSLLQRFTATFIQHCEGRTTTLFGCVHYEQ